MHFLNFSIRQALQGLWRNRVMNIAATITMILMLILLSALVIVISGVEAGLEYIESRVEVRAEIHDGLRDETRIEFQERIAAHPLVSSISFTSKDEALAKFVEARQATEAAELTFFDNPFFAYYSVEMVDPRRSAELVEFLRSEDAVVRQVLGQQTGIDRLVELTSQLRNLGVVVLAFVGLTVLLIVVNSIRMALMARAQEIEIMRLVGASDRYVRWPFILEGVFIGLFGAIVTLLLLLLASAPIERSGHGHRRRRATGLRTGADPPDRRCRHGSGFGPRWCGRLDQRPHLLAPLEGSMPDRPTMTTTDIEPNPQSQPEPAPASAGGFSVGLAAMLLLAISAAIVFWAGLSLGAQTVGRDGRERTAIEAFAETYQRISDEYIGVADPGELLDAAICGMFDTLEDPYSVCMPPGEYESRLEDVTGEFGGIGAVMDTSDPGGDECEPIGLTCGLRVVEVLKDAPAQQAGLQVDDRITAVDGGPLEGLTITDSVLLIRGPRGSAVTLTLERDGQEQDLVITRDTIVTQDVRSAVLEDGKVGYLSIENFSSHAAEDFRTELGTLLEADIDKLVLDVRGDPGGFVDAAIDISSQFLGDGVVFWEEDADGQQRAVDATGGGLATEPTLELVVLVDRGSASASEIMAGALQDAGRARLVGENTFGKGTVQEWTELPGESGGFRLSVAKWLTRDKTWIDGVGLSPDVRIAAGGRRYRAAGADDDPEGDPQLQEAIALLLGRSLAEGSSAPVTTGDPPVSPVLPDAPEESAVPLAPPVPSASPAASDPPAS